MKRGRARQTGNCRIAVGRDILRVSRSADGDGMRTLVRKSCGSSEEEDEDGGGRDGPWSATDEDFARRPRRRSTRGSSQDPQGRATDRRVSKRQSP